MNITERLSKLITSSTNSTLKVKIDETLPITEQANTFFNKVCNLDSVKRCVYLNIISEKQINTLLIGPPATAKSLIAQTIREKCNNVIYYDGASGGSGAGLISLLQNNKKARYLVIDELDKMKKNDQNVILGLLESGSVDKDLKNEHIHFKMDVNVVMTANSNKKLGKAFLSRSDVYYLEEYTNEEFIEVVSYCLKDEILPATASLIAQVLIENELKDVRTALSIAKKLRPGLSEEDIITIIEDKVKHSSNKIVDYN